MSRAIIITFHQANHMPHEAERGAVCLDPLSPGGGAAQEKESEGERMRDQKSESERESLSKGKLL